MAVMELGGTIWRAECLTIAQYDAMPDPTDLEAIPFVNVIEAEEPEPEPEPDPDVPRPDTIPGLYVRYNDPDEGYTYIPYEEIPYPDSSEDDTANPPVSDTHTYTVNESNGTIFLVFLDEEEIPLGVYSQGNITWLETYATQIEADLRGTKWRWNEEISFTPLLAYNISVPFDPDIPSYAGDEEGLYCRLLFTSDGTNFIGFLDESNIPLDETGEFTVAYNFGEWENEAYRLFEITGGTDATNPSIVAFMYTHATQIIDQTVLPSFSDVEVTPHEGYITMTINGVDFNLKTAASVSLISFRVTIRGETPSFNAEEGMTWAEWVASEYNTDGFSISGSNVVYIDLVVTYDGSAVSPSDVIIAHTIYYTATGD